MDLQQNQNQGDHEFNLNLLKTLEKIESVLGLSPQDMASLLSASEEQYKNIKLSRNTPTLTHLRSMSDALELNLSMLLSGQINFETLFEHYHGRTDRLPARYLETHHQLSRARGIQVIDHYLSKVFGTEYSRSIFGRLQLKPTLFTNPDTYVSSLVGLDLLEELKKDGVSEGAFSRIGRFSVEVNSENLGINLKEKQTAKEVYGSLYNEILPHYDQAYHYRITQLSDIRCTITATPKVETQEAFKAKAPGSRDLCCFKQGVIKSFLASSQNKYPALRESSCMYKGDSACTYHLSW